MKQNSTKRRDYSDKCVHLKEESQISIYLYISKAWSNSEQTGSNGVEGSLTSIHAGTK